MDFFSILGNIGKAAVNAALSGLTSGNKGPKPEDCEWYCDCCDEHLNEQPGFTTATGTWICLHCGEVNDVSEDNIWDDVDDAPYDPEWDEP